ncbi:MAG: hypothetical protein PHS14_10365, partial [Elusimicrobia bacterium]|nr:hypothetical protein [Elusimicrobiota bacterium]
RLKIRFEAPRALDLSRRAAALSAAKTIRYTGEMTAATYARWEPTLAKLYAAPAARRRVVFTLTSLSDLPAALELIQLSTLWREQDALSRVSFVLDLKNDAERARAETLLRGAATRVLPGWNAVALDWIEVLPGASPEARAALARDAVSLP